MNQLLPLLLFLTALGSPALGAPAISCHCFQDRSFDPRHPAAVDPYLLANAQNSMLAAVYGISKSDLVKAKMGGADGDRLWVVHAIARAAGTALTQVQSAWERSGSWAPALFLLETDPSLLGASVSTAIGDGADDHEIATALIDGYLQTRLGIPSAEVALMRRSGGRNREVILASVLSRIIDRKASRIIESVLNGRRSWGEWSDEAGLDPAGLEGQIRELVAKGAGAVSTPQ